MQKERSVAFKIHTNTFPLSSVPGTAGEAYDLQVGWEGTPLCNTGFGAVGSDVGQINEVTLRRDRLVLGWVTVSVRVIYPSLTNHPGKLSLAIPSWVSAMSTGQRVVMLCD